MRNSSRSISPGCVGSRSDGTRIIPHLLVVIHKLYVRRPCFRPTEADSVPVIDPNAKLAPSATRQLFQAVPRRDSQFTERLHRIHQIELASCDTPKILWARSPRSLRATSVEDVLGCVSCKGQNHEHMIARLACYSNFLHRPDSPAETRCSLAIQRPPTPSCRLRINENEFGGTPCLLHQEARFDPDQV